MDTALATLLNILEDEFRSYTEVRVRVSPRAGTQRSPDLPQDYDPDSHDLHVRRGVTVQTARREYYFPVEWTRERGHDRIRAQIEEILEFLRRD